jgi:hypothetical protein
MIEGDRKTGVYGAYWNVTIAPDDMSSPIQGTLSEKVWAKTGLPPPDSTTHAKATAKQNTNGRWNVVNVDAGSKELRGVLATLINFEGSPEKNQPNHKIEGITSNAASYVFRIRQDGTAGFEARVPRRLLEMLGIQSFPVNYTLMSDWSRETWGWKLEHICDQSLLSFFSTQNSESPKATGHPATAWRFDDGTKELLVDFETDIAGLSLRCKLYPNILRSAGVRSLTTQDVVKAHLALRDGRWRLAELMEPRPDMAAQRKGPTLYAIDTRFAFQETNNFGELVDWLEIQDDRIVIGVASLNHAKLIEIEEGALRPGARIVCDLTLGKKGWYASRIHRVADQEMAETSRAS